MASSNLVLEVCIDSLESVEKVIDIVEQGSNRFEVCSNLIHGGGLTPSIGLIKAILKRYPQARLMAMIRPRIGDFVYSDAELEVMEQDILQFKAAGVMGVVFGCLTNQSRVDVIACQRLAAVAHPLPITFHRAVDALDGDYPWFEDIGLIEGVTRILSSGRAMTAADGVSGLADLSRWAKEKDISILPGAGINAQNVGDILGCVFGVKEIHLTGSKVVKGSVALSASLGDTMGFGPDEKWILDRRRIEAVWEVMQNRMINV